MNNMDKVELVTRYYQDSLWTKQQVKKAIGIWITEEDAKTILGDEYDREEV